MLLMLDWLNLLAPGQQEDARWTAGSPSTETQAEYIKLHNSAPEGRSSNTPGYSIYCIPSRRSTQEATCSSPAWGWQAQPQHIRREVEPVAPFVWKEGIRALPCATSSAREMEALNTCRKGTNDRRTWSCQLEQGQPFSEHTVSMHPGKYI